MRAKRLPTSTFRTFYHFMIISGNTYAPESNRKQNEAGTQSQMNSQLQKFTCRRTDGNQGASGNEFNPHYNPTTYAVSWLMFLETQRNRFVRLRALSGPKHHSYCPRGKHLSIRAFHLLGRRSSLGSGTHLDEGLRAQTLWEVNLGRI